MSYILAIDQGTTSSRAIIYNEKFESIGVGQKEFPQYFPKPGWVEHDLEEIWNSITYSINEAIVGCKDSSFHPGKISAIGITNQRETFGVWDRKTGRPISKAIVWQCRRSQEICEQLKKKPIAKKICTETGLVLDPYFSGTKLKWLLDLKPEWRKKAKQGKLAFGTIDSYLIWKLTGGESHVTDITNASRTLMMNLKKGTWSDLCLKALGIPKEVLPEIKDSDALFGETKGLNVLPDGLKIHGVLGDQQSALFGQTCFKVGEAKCTYGTGAFLLLNTGEKIKRTKSGLSTVAWRVKEKTCYALEGSVFIAGAAVQWLRDEIQFVKSSPDVEELAKSVDSSEGVFVIPAFAGLGAPHWDPKAKAVIGGLSRGSNRAHIARATLEGIAYSIGDLYTQLKKDGSQKRRAVLYVDGGASLNNLLMQFQADLLQTKIKRPLDVESTAKGAAFVAALGCGLVKNLRQFRIYNPADKSFSPNIKAKQAADLQKIWQARVRALKAGCY